MPPPYSPQRLADIILGFYQFLTTIHYEVDSLKLPPQDGWPGFTRESCAGWKSDAAIELLRRLPCFDSRAAIHYKSKLVDYSSLSLEHIKAETADREEGAEFWSNEGRRNAKHFVYLAWGHESGGRELLLNVKDGEITEDVLETSTLPPRNIQEYFDALKDEYRSLRLIPCVGRITIEAENVSESTSRITEEQILDQGGDWGTDLDVQYIRQLYREYGWPDRYRREEAEQAIEKLMEKVMDRRGDEWELEMEDWLTDYEPQEGELGEESEGSDSE